MRAIITLFFISAILISCEKCNPPGENDWQEGVIYFTGEIALDGCGWLLLSEGETYFVDNLDNDFKIDGLDVWFKARHLDETYKCGLAGTEYSVLSKTEMIVKPWEVRFLSEYPGRKTSMDLFSMDSVHVDGDSLRMHVGYSGGCAEHQFNLWALETGLDGDGDIHLMLEHIGNGDPCEAYPWEWLAFSLEPLRETGTNSVTFWLRGSPQMSMLFGPYTYEY